MSPEQADGLPADKRSDIWSYGVVLWEMLTGQRLFDAPTVTRAVADVLRKESVSPSLICNLALTNVGPRSHPTTAGWPTSAIRPVPYRSSSNRFRLEKGRWQISTDGGDWPIWRRDGKELFFRQGIKVMATPIRLTNHGSRSRNSATSI